MMKVLQETKRQFQLRAASYDRSACWVRDEGLLGFHKRVARVSPKDNILDICCGTGIIGNLFQGQVASVTGIDISPEMLLYAKRRLDVCRLGNCENLPFHDNTFGLVICRQALHLVKDLRRALREMYRVTSSSHGQVIVSQIVPFGNGDCALVRKIHYKKQPLMKRLLKEERLVKEIQRTGFQDIKIHDYIITEPIKRWLKKAPETKKRAKREIISLLLNAPATYRRLHQTRVVNGEIYDNMRWVIITGFKDKR